MPVLPPIAVPLSKLLEMYATITDADSKGKLSTVLLTTAFSGSYGLKLVGASRSCGPGTIHFEPYRVPARHYQAKLSQNVSQPRRMVVNKDRSTE